MDEVNHIINRLEHEYPTIKIALDFSNPMELLVATILSAQSTDAGVNKITPKLFERCKTVSDYAEISIEELEHLIFSSGFYHNKAKNIKACAMKIMDSFNGIVPSTMEELLTLPGVARKTANIVLYHAFGIEVGIAVDTHVKRISKLIGLTDYTDPVKIEKDLMKLIPNDKWGSTNTLLIQHGRNVCIANKPKCNECCINSFCKNYLKSKSI